jgi:hypothetical protein
MIDVERCTIGIEIHWAIYEDYLGSDFSILLNVQLLGIPGT